MPARWTPWAQIPGLEPKQLCLEAVFGDLFGVGSALLAKKAKKMKISQGCTLSLLSLPNAASSLFQAE